MASLPVDAIPIKEKIELPIPLSSREGERNNNHQIRSSVSSIISTCDKYIRKLPKRRTHDPVTDPPKNNFDPTAKDSKVNNYFNVDAFILEQKFKLEDMVKLSESVSLLEGARPKMLRAFHQSRYNSYTSYC